jgi:hypothetical protein
VVGSCKHDDEPLCSRKDIPLLSKRVLACQRRTVLHVVTV